MMKSMTAFGRAKSTVGGRDITVEIKSVNNRYLDLTVKMPRAYSFLEEKIKPYLTAKGISRGKLDVYIGIEVNESEGAEISVDTALAEGYLKAYQALRDTFGLRDDISVMSLARNSDIFKVKKPEEDAERDWEMVREVLDAAAGQFISAREREGASIESDLIGKIEIIRNTVNKIEELSLGDISDYKEKLRERIHKMLSDNNISIDESRILTECAIFADKVAIDEELVRLRTHFSAFEEYANSSEPVGRKLDFLMQEMNREINTIGSKCNNSNIARYVVEVKTELEKVREQIQNIE
ncbi:MAG: YicC/YloC family endoribonuclease [Clostridia bacterium]|nr:YicC/YloC family endoribonuclease [Clostridia bacterium]